MSSCWKVFLPNRSSPERNHERAAVTPAEDAQRKAILARLGESRAEIKRLLEPRPSEAGEGSAENGSEFPRSRTMRALMSGRGLGAVGATAAGLIMARPALAWRLFRMLPAGPLLRMGLARILGAMGRSSHKP
jgi:hypothetical protein